MGEKIQMVDEKKETSETLYSVTIPKMNSAGTREVGSYRFEKKVYNDSKFSQITQTKYAYGQTPAKSSWITFNPADKDFQKALSDFIKA